MLIDKTKFLALVAAISTASAACIIVDDDDGDGIGGDNEGAGNQGAGNQGAGNQGGDGQGGTGGGGPTCLDDTGNPAACDSTCEGFTNCNGVPSLKEGVEEAMVECMNALDPVTCSFDTDVLNGCYIDAAGKACPDPASDVACMEAATACDTANDSAWLSNCAAFMDGLNASGQALYQTCVEDQCTAGSTPTEALDYCVWDVVFPTG